MAAHEQALLLLLKMAGKVVSLWCRGDYNEPESLQGWTVHYSLLSERFNTSLQHGYPIDCMSFQISACVLSMKKRL